MALGALVLASCGEQRASVEPEAPAPAFDVDAGDCPARARVAPMCVRAMTERCRGQQSGCESACESQFGSMPGNTEKEPGIRGDMETTQCRQRCGDGYPACTRALLSHCPEPCP